MLFYKKGVFMDKVFLNDCLSEIGVNLAPNALDKLEGYFGMVVEQNKAFNLTAITEEKDFVVKHIEDSLAGISLIPDNAKLLDIGAGAGFPCMPIAVAREDVSVTALDSTAKKMTFLASCTKTLGVSNLSTVSARAEDKRDLFGKFDVVTARAVSSLQILLELAMPFLKVGGRFIAYKTDESELDTSQNARKILNAKHVETKSLTLANGEKRALLVFEKTAPTPKQYPRQYGTIKKKPL